MSLISKPVYNLECEMNFALQKGESICNAYLVS